MKQYALTWAIGISLLGLTGCPNNPANTDGIPEGTLHQGKITASETWTKAQNPHVIRGTVEVEGSQAAAKLTLEPGVIVKFEAEAALDFGFNGSGILEAKGTATESITFTGATQTKGSWKNVTLRQGATLSTLEYCQFKHGGKGDQGALRITGATNAPTVKNCTFEDNFGYAVMADNDAFFTEFSNNTLKGSEKNPLYIQADAVGSLGEGNTFTNNGQNAIYVEGTDINKSARWRNHGIPYRVLDHDLSVSKEGKTLILDPGCVLEFGAGLRFSIGDTEGSSLYAVGTGPASTESITLTSVAGAKWNGLWFWNSATHGKETDPKGCYLDYVTVENGGGLAGDHANIKLYNTKPILKNLTIKNSNGYGIWAQGSLIPSEAYLNAAMIAKEGNSQGDLYYELD